MTAGPFGPAESSSMARQREFDECEVLDRAVACFWQTGYQATSVRDLAAHMAITGTSLYNAFVESKRRARTRMRYAGSLSAMLPWLIDDVEEIDQIFGGDAFPYGIEANRASLQALVTYMVEQHFIARAIPIEDLFVPIPGASGT